MAKLFLILFCFSAGCFIWTEASPFFFNIQKSYVAQPAQRTTNSQTSVTQSQDFGLGGIFSKWLALSQIFTDKLAAKSPQRPRPTQRPVVEVDSNYKPEKIPSSTTESPAEERDTSTRRTSTTERSTSTSTDSPSTSEYSTDDSTTSSTTTLQPSTEETDTSSTTEEDSYNPGTTSTSTTWNPNTDDSSTTESTSTDDSSIDGSSTEDSSIGGSSTEGYSIDGSSTDGSSIDDSSEDDSSPDGSSSDGSSADGSTTTTTLRSTTLHGYEYNRPPITTYRPNNIWTTTTASTIDNEIETDDGSDANVAIKSGSATSLSSVGNRFSSSSGTVFGAISVGEDDAESAAASTSDGEFQVGDDVNTSGIDPRVYYFY